MDLKLTRTELTSESTVGELTIDGDFECFTLEDVVRPVKIKGMTAIPGGIYEIVISHSARFGRLLPLLLNVPNFDGIRIHAGNTAADTEGCILVGQGKARNSISASRAAFGPLFDKLQAAAASEKIFIEITDSEQTASRGMAMAHGAKSLRREMTLPSKAAKPEKADKAEKAEKAAKPAKLAKAAAPAKAAKAPKKAKATKAKTAK